MNTGSTAKAVLVLWLGVTFTSALAGPQTDVPIDDLSSHRYVANEVLVQFKPGVSEADKAQVHNKANVARKERVGSLAVRSRKGDIELDSIAAGVSVQETLRKLRNEPTVELAEPNWVYTHQVVANDFYYTRGNLWGTYGDDLPSPSGPSGSTNPNGSQAEKAWGAGHTGSKQIYVGIIDEGVQFTHPDLDARVIDHEIIDHAAWQGSIRWEIAASMQ